MHSPAGLAFEYSLYALGFIGLFAIALIPIRSWHVLRKNFAFLRASTTGKVIFWLLVLLGMATIAVEAQQVAHIFRCLIGLHCGANRAAGWFSAAAIGFCYLCFEVAIVLILSPARRFLPGPIDK